MIGRRAFLTLAAALATRPAFGDVNTAALRFLRVRGRTLLVDIDGRRALVDPCFAPDLGAAVLFNAPAASVVPEEIGDIDLLLVSAREAGAFDGASTARLRGRSASCFVPDDDTAKILRHQGYRRVRVVAAGDVFSTRGVTVRVSPSRALLGGAGVGFHLERNGRTLWHAGAPPPLDVAGESAQFAHEHAAEVVAASAFGLKLGGAGRTVDHEDALLLAGLAHARYAIFLEDDVSLSIVGGLLVKDEPGPRGPPSGVRVRALVVEEGRWYRVLPQSSVVAG